MSPRPPVLARILLSAVADPATRDAQLGDLHEEFCARHGRAPGAARRWYRRQALRSVAPNLARRLHALRASRHYSVHGGDPMLSTLVHDLGRALRALTRRPAANAVLVLILAGGIGANTTIFSAVHGLVLAPFPFPEPDRVVGIGSVHPRLDGELGFVENLSPAEYEDIRDGVPSLEDVVAWDMGNRQLTGESGIPDNVRTGFFWGDALRTLQMDAHLGRGFSDAEIEGLEAVAVLSYPLWRDRYGADSTLVGGTLRVNDYPHTVVGVLPPGVDLFGMELWTLMAVPPARFPRERRQFQVIGRIAEGRDLGAVNQELETLARRVEADWVAELDEYEGWTLEAWTWTNVATRPIRAGAFVLMASVGFVLLIACANAAGLLMARAHERRKEMAVQTALGAGRGRLFAQLLGEASILATLGAVGGIAMAWVGVAWVRSLLLATGLPVAGSVALDGPVLAFTAAVTVGVAILFGTLPALHASRVDPGSTLRAETRASTGGGPRMGVQRALVALEVAVAVVLLAGGGLLVNSFLRLSAVEPGFAHEDVLTMRLTLPREEYEGDAVPAFFRALVEGIEAVPGVTAAAAGSQFPPMAAFYEELSLEDGRGVGGDTAPVAQTTVVTGGYFEALGIPVVRGRVFTDLDAEGAQPVAVINAAAAARFFPGRDPIGERFQVGGADPEGPWWEVVGVVADTRNRGLEQDPFPEVFALHEQIGGVQNQLFLLVRADVEPASLLPAVRAVVGELDADQPVYQVRTVEDAFAQAVATRRATTTLLAGFGLFALLLSALGTYAVVAQNVRRRTREIGLRVALGSDGAGVQRMVVRQALVPVGVGAAVGLALTLPLAAGLRQLLFEVSATDPATLGSVVGLLLVTAALASWLPARRASRLDPLEALRAD